MEETKLAPLLSEEVSQGDAKCRGKFRQGPVLERERERKNKEGIRMETLGMEKVHFAIHLLLACRVGTESLNFVALLWLWAVGGGTSKGGMFVKMWIQRGFVLPLYGGVGRLFFSASVSVLGVSTYELI